MLLQSVQVVFPSEELFDLSQHFFLDPRIRAEFFQVASVSLECFFAFAATVIDVARADSTNDFFVWIFGVRNERLRELGGLLVQTFVQLQFDDVFVKVFVSSVLLQELLPNGNRLIDFLATNEQLALQLRNFRLEFRVNLLFARLFQIRERRVVVQRASLDDGLLVPDSCVAGIVVQCRSKLLQRDRVVALLGMKEREQQTVCRVRSAVFDLLF